MGPDMTRGGGWGNPEQRAELLEEHQQELADEIQQDHLASEASRDAKAGRPSFWRWLFRRRTT